MRRPARGAFLAAGILGAVLLGGCGDGGAEVSVPQVEVIEQPQISQTEEQREAQLDPESEAGTVLGEEEVTVMTPEGEPQTALYTRVRGNGDFSIAYDKSRFSIAASAGELRFEPSEEQEPAFLSIRTEDAPSAEELADQYVADSGEECSVEEMTIGRANIRPCGSAMRKGQSQTAAVAACTYSAITAPFTPHSWTVLPEMWK